MVLREARRFFMSARLLSVSAMLVVALGLGMSGLALGLLLPFSSPTYPISWYSDRGKRFLQ